MTFGPRIEKIEPNFAAGDGYVHIFTAGLSIEPRSLRVTIGGAEAVVKAAGPKRIIVRLPEAFSGEPECVVESGIDITPPFRHGFANHLTEGLHNVSSPAVDPATGAIYAMRSGSRGMQLVNTLYRLEPDGYLDELPVQVMNPSGLAFGPDGKLYVTNRALGELFVIDSDLEATRLTTGLGIATGIAFDKNGMIYVGDRSGTIFRCEVGGIPEHFAQVEPSVAAFHLAFGPDERLYVTSPGLASRDAIYAIDRDGTVETFLRAFGRPQGLAFDRDGNIYLAANYQGQQGIFRVSPVKEVEWIASAHAPVGLCFTAKGEMIVATHHELYSFDANILGTLV